MQARGDQLLAGTALADDEYGFGQNGGTRHVLEHFEKNRCFADDLLHGAIGVHWRS